MRANPANTDIDLVHGPRLHRRRLPQQRGDDLRHADPVGRAHRRHAASLVGELFGRTMGHQGSAGARVRPAADLRARHRGRLRVLPAEPRRRRRQATEGGHASVPRRGQPGPAARRRADVLARDGAAASASTSTARRRRSSACRSTTSSARSSGTLGTYYVNDFNKYGRTWQVLMSADPSYRNRPDDIGGVYVRSRRRRHGAAQLARDRALQLGPRLARPLQQPAGGQDPRPGRAGLSAPARRSRASSRSRRRCCPPTSASTGAASATRRSARAARRRSRSRSP